MKLSKRVSVCLRRPWISRAELWEGLESGAHGATAEQMQLLGPVLAFRYHWARPLAELGLIALLATIDLVVSLFPRRRASGVGFVIVRWLLWDIVIDDHNVAWRDAEVKPAVCVPLPADDVRFNGGVRCDVSYGPCACGATHLPVPPRSTVGEPDFLTLDQLKQLAGAPYHVGAELASRMVNVSPQECAARRGKLIPGPTGWLWCSHCGGHMVSPKEPLARCVRCRN